MILLYEHPFSPYAKKVKIELSGFGSFVIALMKDQAPKHVESFLAIDRHQPIADILSRSQEAEFRLAGVAVGAKPHQA